MGVISRRTVLSGLLGGSAVGVLAPPLGQGEAVGEPARPPKKYRPRTREYWLQIEPVQRDAAPTKYDPMMDATITERTVWNALVYRAYTEDWGAPLHGNPRLGPNDGFPGPVLRAHPGDTLVVHVRNSDTQYYQVHSLHLHGVRYKPASDGSWTSTFTQPGSAIQVGDTYTYRYDVLETSIGTWPYHDHSKPYSIPGAGGGTGSNVPTMTMGAHGTQGINKAQPVMEIGAELGLMGHVVIEDPTAPRPDREFYLTLSELYVSDVPNLDGDVDLFNGRSFLGNTPTFTAKVGEHVRWHVIALGTEFHVFHVHGHRWRSGGRNLDSEMLGPSTSLQIDWVEDNPGRWLYHCHVVEHMMGGMVGWYVVDPQ